MACQLNSCIMLSILTLLGLIISISAVVVAGEHSQHVRVPRRDLEAVTTTTSAASNQRLPLLSSQGKCVPFHHHYCSNFGYNYTISPNPWARGLSLEQAASEFGDFNNLMRRNCSDKLGTLLCFTYFPLCYEKSPGNMRLILPCKETCNIVHTSDCNDLVLSSVGEWGKHLRCTNFHTKSETENGNCADGDQVEWTEGITKDGDDEKIIMTTVPSPTEGDDKGNESCDGEPPIDLVCSDRELLRAM